MLMLDLGELFDAWLARHLTHFDRLVIAFRAKFFLTIIIHDLDAKCEKHHDIFHHRRSFISIDAREILTRLADSLLLLIRAHGEYYPDIPLFPEDHGTEDLEHLFGV